MSFSDLLCIIGVSSMLFVVSVYIWQEIKEKREIKPDNMEKQENRPESKEGDR